MSNVVTTKIMSTFQIDILCVKDTHLIDFFKEKVMDLRIRVIK